MKVTKEILEKVVLLTEEINFSEEKKMIGLEGIDFIKELIKYEKYDLANKLLIQCMTYKQYVSYAIYAVEQVMGVFEKIYPNDKKLHIVLRSIKNYIKKPTEKNKVILIKSNIESEESHNQIENNIWNIRNKIIYHTFTKKDLYLERNYNIANYISNAVFALAKSVIYKIPGASYNAVSNVSLAITFKRTKMGYEVVDIERMNIKNKLKFIKYGLNIIQ